MSAVEEIRDLFVQAFDEMPPDYTGSHLHFALLSKCLRVLATHVDAIEIKLARGDQERAN